MRWPRLLSALTARNYRLYFIGQMISLVGTWMTQTTSLWLIYHLSSSALFLGLIGFANQIPIFILGPLAGVCVERANRHRLLVATQTLSLLQAMALAALALTRAIDVAWLVGLTFAKGLINAFDMPTRQALVIEFVDRKEHLGNAIALNSSLFNLARLAGPAIAGFVIAAFPSGVFGAGICYLIDGLSYLAVIAALFAMRLRPRPSRPPAQHPWTQLRQGFHYAFGFAPIRALLVLVALISFTGFSYTVLMPIFARDIFAGNARTLAYLMAAAGLGALSGALYLSSRTTVRGLGKVITLGGTLMGAGLISVAASHWLVLSLLCLALVGMGGVLLMASSNTLVQTLVDDDKRGRVMSLFTMAFTGTTPLGNLAVGALAAKIGAAPALALSGALCGLVIYRFYQKIPQLRTAAAPILARLDPTAGEPVLFSPPPSPNSPPPRLAIRLPQNPQR